MLDMPNELAALLQLDADLQRDSEDIELTGVREAP
jgi:hypothetical protein